MVVIGTQAAHDEHKKRGVNVTDVNPQVWGKLFHFNDPDSDSWTVLESPPRGQFEA